MILNGLGGKIFSQQHAENSARLANAVQPEYLATLVVSFPQGEQRFRADFPEWEPLGQRELFGEMERFLSPPFIRGARYGTRASTVLAIGHDGRASFHEKRYGADGVFLGETREEF